MMQMNIKSDLLIGILSFRKEAKPKDPEEKQKKNILPKPYMYFWEVDK